MNSPKYEILDEPQNRWSAYAVSPLLLLLISFFIPKPYQYLMPLAFLVNAWLMGCHNLRAQITTVVLGALAISFVFFTLVGLVSSGFSPISLKTAGPYLGILLNAGLLAWLYRLMMLQNPTFEILSYIRAQQSANTL